MAGGVGISEAGVRGASARTLIWRYRNEGTMMSLHTGASPNWSLPHIGSGGPRCVVGHLHRNLCPPGAAMKSSRLRARGGSAGDDILQRSSSRDQTGAPHAFSIPRYVRLMAREIDCMPPRYRLLIRQQLHALAKSIIPTP
jgi:hypothetical protein